MMASTTSAVQSGLLQPLSTLSANGETSNKGRASSCTSCRQSKLKCDLREKYPSHCTRCVRNRTECKTDPTFRRIPAKSRIKHMQSRIDHLERAQDEDARLFAPRRPLAIRPSAQGTTTDGLQGIDADSGTLGHGNEPAADSNTKRWLQLVEVSTVLPFALEAVTFSYGEIVEIFHCFEQLYYPHFCILEPVTSLLALSRDSELLFWTIVNITIRQHVRYRNQYDLLLAAHGRLFARVTMEAVQSLPDLQAVLMSCTWPAMVKGQLKDPSWMRLGMAINSARQMGLDKNVDEVFFGQRRSHYQLGKHAAVHRRLTWLKCFELEMQMSCWLGLMSTLANTQSLRAISCFIQDERVPRAYAAVIEVHLQTALSLITLEEGLPGQVSPSLVRVHYQTLNEIKVTRSHEWTVNAEITLLAARLYISALCLLKLGSADDDSPAPNRNVDVDRAFAQETLAGALTSAVRLSGLLTDISDRRASDETAQWHAVDSHPLPGSPKGTSRVAFFAAIILLKCIESQHDLAGAETAREAFSQVYRMFSCCAASHEHIDASRTLEVAGRAVGHGQTRMQTYVTTRMAASFIYNAIWLTSILRGRDTDPDYSPAAAEAARAASVSGDGSTVSPTAQSAMPVAVSYASAPVSVEPEMSQMPYEYCNTSGDHLDGMNDFPFGVWDDDVYDNWMSFASTNTSNDWDFVSVPYNMPDQLSYDTQ